ncbi:hypothetical protein [Qipengyuania huizhouensis]|uniref:hypothetical protein n=1 Tax=Qipengyuania huizhouensis TaxID=2867245 RepID=UPI001C879531|nr:hypothetical protein [Qipengyuania huizhouensis]
MSKLFTPISFLRLKSPDLILYQWVLPTFGTIFLYMFVLNPFGWGLSFHIPTLLRDVNSLVGVLVGFYIAALAAVSTFPNSLLDQPLEGVPTTLKRRAKGGMVEDQLSRRRYLAMVLGYCALVSVIIYIFGVLQLNVSFTIEGPSYAKIFNELAFYVLWFFYLWLLISLLVATLVGLHYLVDRMHR